MARIRVQKTSFAAGEVSPRLLGRNDLRAYGNGAMRLRNVVIHPTGGVTRRAGLRYVTTAAGPGRLVAFEFNTAQVYLLAFTDGAVDVYRDDAHVAALATPWSTQQIAHVNWTQSADTLLAVHPEVPPKKITRTSDSDWQLTDWAFFEEDGRVFAPHHKFADEAVTVTPSGTVGTITVTASADVFDPDHAGVRLRIADKEIEVTSVTSASVVVAEVKESLSGTAATKDWQEQAFSPVRGWPVSVCFHQDRMVIGGSRDLPNRLWLSKSADLFNFDQGEGLDDEAIEFAILSDQVNAVRAVFSGRHLQVFTSGAEWMATGDPLTPTNIQLHRQTRIGSPVDRAVPPRDVDGATLFVPRERPELREFLFADVEQVYQAADFAMLAQHLIDSPVDMDFDKGSRLFHAVMAGGTLATLTIFRAEEVTAWTLLETEGAFRSVVVAGDSTYVLVERGGDHFVEVFDAALNVDSGLVGSAAQPTAVWSGLDHLEGKTVTILADGAMRAEAAVAAGAFVLDQPARHTAIGLAYAHVVEPLPPAADGSGGGRVRPVSLTLRLRNTAALHLDTGRGLVEVPFKRFGSGVLDSPPPVFTGDKTVRAFGWRLDATEPLRRIEQDTPLPFTLLSVSAEMSVND